jgi:hypothetical protein
VSKEELEVVRSSGNIYSSLSRLRETLRDAVCGALLSKANDAEEMHYKTLDFKKDLQDGNHDQALRLLYEVGGHLDKCPVTVSPSLRPCHNREAFVRSRNERCAYHQKIERARRQKAQKIFRREIGAVLAAKGGVTHYAILGVSELADRSNIRRAYRDFALRLHPDKNKVCELRVDL